MYLRHYLHLIWRMRWPLLATHAIVTAITLALVSPLLGGAVRVALHFSGRAALSDQDIVMFLISPTGLVVFLIIGSLAVTAAMIELSVMMSVLAAAERGERRWGLTALTWVAMRLPDLLHLAALLILRVLITVLPFVAMALVIVFLRLREHDINYYIAAHPPEVATTALIVAPILALGFAVLLQRLLGWILVLPVVLFADVTPRAAFARSAELASGRKVRLLWLSGLLGALAFAVGIGVTGLTAALAELATGIAGDSLGRLVAAMTVLVVIWVVLLTVASTLTSAGAAALLLDRFSALGGAPILGITRPSIVSRRSMAQIAVLVVFVCGTAAWLGMTLMETLKPVDRIEVIAHRGAAGVRPENSLASIRKAIDDGADWVEIDVQESADGEVFVLHDSDFMKVAGNPVKAWDVTRAQLDGIDIGSKFDPAYRDERAPLLRDVLDAAKGRAKVLIELKYYGHNQDLERRVAEIVEAAGMEEDIALMSLNAAAIARMKALRPDWSVGLLAATAFGDLNRLGVDFLAVKTSLARPSLMRHARDADRPVLVWTVNDVVTMSQMMSRGVSGLITDYPARARQVIEARAGLNTAERLLIELGDILDLDVPLPTRTTEGP